MFNVCYKKNGFPNKEKGTYKSNNNRKICTHCGMSGHTIENCYKKHGYPPGYKSFNGKPTQVHSIVATDTVFSEKCQQEQDNGNVQLTPVPYQILVDLFKQSQNNVETSNVGQAQVNQIGSFSADYSHKVVDPSSTGKLLSYNNLQYLKSC